MGKRGQTWRGNTEGLRHETSSESWEHLIPEGFLPGSFLRSSPAVQPGS